MLDKLTVQIFLGNPLWIEEPLPHIEEKMCMQDNVCNNFVLPALYSEASPLLCLLCPSWWPCMPDRVGASTTPVG